MHVNVTSKPSQMSQIELETPRKITHVATQGRFDFDVYTKTFQLAYSEDGENFTVYQEGGLDKVRQQRSTGVSSPQLSA